MWIMGLRRDMVYPRAKHKRYDNRLSEATTAIFRTFNNALHASV